MKIFLKNFLIAMPLAIGAIFTMFSVQCAMGSYNPRYVAGAILWGLVGIPTLFAAIQNISKE